MTTKVIFYLLLTKKRTELLILTAATEMPKSAMIPDSTGDEYPVYKANHNAYVQ